MNKVVLYCRPGFEKECAAEITDKAARLEVFGFARVKEDSGYVIFEGYQQDDGEKLVRDLRVHQILEGTNEIMRVIVARHLLNTEEPLR